MQITTKYDPGDVIFLIGSNKIQDRIIEHVHIHGYKPEENANNMKQTYTVEYQVQGFQGDFNEDKLFPTKQELIDSL